MKEQSSASFKGIEIMSIASSSKDNGNFPCIYLFTTNRRIEKT